MTPSKQMPDLTASAIAVLMQRIAELDALRQVAPLEEAESLDRRLLFCRALLEQVELGNTRPFEAYAFHSGHFWGCGDG